jgi:hypothetical protein
MTDAQNPVTREELAKALSALYYERGNDVRTWPEDEAEAYRELRWSEGSQAARDVINLKSADAILAAFTVLHPAPVATEQVKLDPDPMPYRYSDRTRAGVGYHLAHLDEGGKLSPRPGYSQNLSDYSPKEGPNE